MMLLPFMPGIGDRVNDANAWVAIGPLSASSRRSS